MQQIKQKLCAMAEPAYRDFASALLPGVENVLGVRLPRLRKLARTLSKGDWRAYLQNAEDETFEERMLQGMVIGYINAEWDETAYYISKFVPKIDNWSVCDSFVASLKVTKRHPEEMWNFLQPYLNSQHEFSVRFAVVMLLWYYIKGDKIDQVFLMIDSVNHQGYYVKMAVAWAVSACYIALPVETDLFLQNNSLDDFTYNKALQKIAESKILLPSQKAVIRARYRR